MHTITCLSLPTAVVWQMMRAYTLSVLQRLAKSDKPITDPEIVEWANETLSAAGKSSSISGFKDPSIANSMPVIDLVDSIKPNSIKYELVNQGASLSDEVILCPSFSRHVHMYMYMYNAPKTVTRYKYMYVLECICWRITGILTQKPYTYMCTCVHVHVCIVSLHEKVCAVRQIWQNERGLSQGCPNFMYALCVHVSTEILWTLKSRYEH